LEAIADWLAMLLLMAAILGVSTYAAILLIPLTTR